MQAGGMEDGRGEGRMEEGREGRRKRREERRTGQKEGVWPNALCGNGPDSCLATTVVRRCYLLFLLPESTF